MEGTGHSITHVEPSKLRYDTVTWQSTLSHCSFMVAGARAWDARPQASSLHCIIYLLLSAAMEYNVFRW